jgi:hypothetical protein
MEINFEQAGKLADHLLGLYEAESRQYRVHVERDERVPEGRLEARVTVTHIGFTMEDLQKAIAFCEQSDFPLRVAVGAAPNSADCVLVFFEESEEFS